MITTYVGTGAKIVKSRRIARTVRSRYLLLIPATILITVMLFAPMGMMLGLSFAQGIQGFTSVLTSPLIQPIAINTVVISVLTTLIAVCLAYACALAAWRAGPVLRICIFGLILLPFWTGVLVKNFAWAVLMQENGAISDISNWLGVGPVSLLHTRTAVIIGMVHYVLPYAVLPIYAVMSRIDPRLELAAASLGASTRRANLHVVLPLTLPGVYSAGLLVFIISTGFFITPVVLGGPSDQMIPNLVEYYARGVVDFRAASIVAMAMVIVVSLLVMAYQRLPKEGQYGNA